MNDLDAESRAAAAALVHRLRNRGEEDGQFSLDDELFAQEFLMSLRGYGWRPVLVPPPEADWRRASRRTPAGSLDPDVKAALVAKMAEASQAIRSGRPATGPQPVLADANDPRARTAPATESTGSENPHVIR
jgi:hypothetical protein